MSAEFRLDTRPDMFRRRAAIALSFCGAIIGIIGGADQTGLIKRLPDIASGKLFEAEKVDGSDYAYKRL